MQRCTLLSSIYLKILTIVCLGYFSVIIFFEKIVLVWWLLTAVVMLRWSFHLTILFSLASLTKHLTITSCTYFCLQLTATLLESTEGRRMAVEIISWSIYRKVWDWAWIELATPWSTVKHVSAVKQATDCAFQTSLFSIKVNWPCFSFIHWRTLKMQKMKIISFYSWNIFSVLQQVK